MTTPILFPVSQDDSDRRDSLNPARKGHGDKRLPSSCTLCPNADRKPTNPCFVCKGMACTDHTRLVRRRATPRRKVHICADCEKQHGPLFEEV